MPAYLHWKIVLGAASAFALHNSAVAETGGESDAARISDTILEALVEANGVPGMSAALVREGEVVWIGSAGLRDVERALPVDADTTFRLASVSKLITATAAARLAEDGDLDLDAPVQSIVRYLPGAWPPISSRQLAAHTSGIPHYQDVDAGRGGVHFDTTEDAVGVFSGRTLLARPGLAYHYSSYGYTLLSAVVEESAGEPFLRYVSRVLLYGLDIRPELGSGPNTATGYKFGATGSLAPIAPHDFSYSWGGAGFLGSSRDLALFGARVLSGPVISPATRDMMWTPVMLDDGSVVSHSQDAEVGFGWRISRDQDNAAFTHHAGVTDGARSALILYPGSGDSVSILSNASWTSSIEQTALMLVAPFRAAANPEPGVPCPLAATGFEGSFKGEAFKGRARFELDRGVCRGRISATNAFGVWLNSFPQQDADELQVIAVSSDSSLDRAALVTPAGVYDLRAKGNNAFEARIGSNSEISIWFN
ncbi:serine hydrolase domain-containing protein [Hyphomonas sp.]|uniref:serine hydrolase domain-containing protein n=1 Tax=Hyphomonas sp. TaxID=87 RepID=UPI0025C03C11|nr:serine hydrolase domain-containing protein [Hyphomonas sp.]